MDLPRIAYTAFLDLLFPPRCPLCHTYTHRRGDWCEPCLQRVRAERRLGLDARTLQFLDSAYVLCRYRDSMKKLIHSLKYQRKFFYLPHIHTFLAQSTILDALSFDIVVPIPLHTDKLKERGFNQTEKIFYPWILQKGFIWLDALERIKKTDPQYGLHRKERRENLRGAFMLKPGAAIKGIRILLLDDIFTTGATLGECAKILKNAGALTVIGLALASDA